MRVGDLLEFVAVVCLVAAAYIWTGLALALLVAAICLGYLAQCYAKSTIRLPRRKPQ